MEYKFFSLQISMQPDLELKFPEQSISDQKLRFLDLSTEIHAPERASRTRPL